MARAVWGIDIGKAALKAVKLKRTKEGLEIKAVEHIEYEASAEEDKRQEQVRTALRTFLGKHKVGGDLVLVALAGLHGFSRFIKLPPVDAAKIGMMVRMEAQQQIPFPISEVFWDFYKIEKEYAPGEEHEIGIFATKRDVIEGYLRELGEAKLEPGVVTLTPLAVYNFVRYNCEIGDGATIVLDVGSDHTDLVIVDGPKFWLRNLRIAGNDITKALAERFKVSFEEAEKLKRTASKSDQSKKIFSSMEPTLKDLVGEIHRSVGFYKSQAGGDLKVTKLVLLGDGSKLKNMQPFFEKELGYTVERISTLGQDKFVLDPEADRELLKKHILSFGVAFGLAIQGVEEPGSCKINLAPDDLKVHEELKRKSPWALAAAACAWGALFASYAQWSSNREALRQTVVASAPIKTYMDYQTQAKALEDAPGPLKKVVDDRLSYVQGRLLPLEFLARLKDVLPKDNGTLISFPLAQRKVGDQWMTISNQISKMEGMRPALDEKKTWLLDLNIDRKPADKGDATRPGVPEGIYVVELKVAKYLGPTATDSGLREQIKSTFVSSLVQTFSGEPFYIRNPEKPPNDGYGEVFVGGNESISQLDKDMKGTPQGREFRCVLFPIKFEIGGPAPAPPAPPK